MKPTIGIVLLCRMSSSRLPGKILRQIQGRSVLGHILDRLRHAVPELSVVIATSDDPADLAIVQAAKREGVAVFRGSLNDVAQRFLGAARAHGWDYAIRLNGDNLLVNVDVISIAASLARVGMYDVISNVPGRPFPFGMTVECVRTDFYAEMLPRMSDAYDREHVTSWLYRDECPGRLYEVPNIRCPEAQGLDLALDTEEDLIRLAQIIERSGGNSERLTLREIYRLATTDGDATPWQGPTGPLLIAEIGGNHEGNFDYACRLTAEAIASGADCVKYQIYQGDTLVSPVESPDRNEHFKRFELTPEQHLYLAGMCREAGVIYLASVWDLAALEWIDPHLSFYKVGSGDMTAWSMLTALARRGKPILLSTGLADLDEVMQTVRHIQSIDPRYLRPEYLCLLQCTAMYPISNEDAHLRVMDRLREATGLAVGYSDHTVGSDALKAATAMGAQVLEFHFTDTRDGKSFRDHKVSLTKAEVRDLRQELLKITALRGAPIKRPQIPELENGHEVSFRRAAYVQRDVNAGEVIRPEDVVFLRPCHGLDARDAYRLEGAVAKRPLKAYRAINPETDI